MNTWETLSQIDCKPRTKKKGNLSYLSWTWAWAEVMNKYPTANYEFEPPVFFSDSSCEVWVAVTIEEVTRKMWLPVMDNRNNSVLNPSSRQIGDCRMRCLTKCLAMFGLGHHIYAGEDIPDQAPVDHSKIIAQYQACADQDGRNAVWANTTEDQKTAINGAPQ